MRLLGFILLLQAFLLAACSSFPVIGDLSVERARRDARDAINSNKITICLAGTRGIYPVGVTEAELPLIVGIPKTKLPNGCTEPKASAAIAYAKEYNRIILEHLTSHEPKES